MFPRAVHSAISKYEGEWMSELLPVTGNMLCVTLSISVPKQFAILAKLFSRASVKSIYEAENVTGRGKKMDLLSVFEVPVSAAEDVHVQLVVYVSLGVAIKTVSMNSGQCPNNSMCLYLALQLFKACAHFIWGKRGARFSDGGVATSDVKRGQILEAKAEAQDKSLRTRTRTRTNLQG